MPPSLAPGLLLAGTATALIVSIFLATGATRHRAVPWVAGLLASLSLRMSKSAIHAFTPLEDWQKNIGLVGMLLSGPFLLQAVRAFAEPDTPRGPRIPHFLPALGFLGLTAWIPNEGGNAIAALVYVALLVHVAIYLALSALALARGSARDGEAALARGLLAVVGGLLAGWAAVFVAAPWAYTALCVAWAALGCGLLWLIVTRHSFVAPLVQAPRYQHLRSNDDEARTLFDAMVARVDADGLLADPTLTLPRLARRLSVAENELSRAVNQHSGMPFRRWLSMRRADLAKRQIDAGWLARRTLGELAEHCGFQSPSTFTRAFKAHTGETPQAYASLRKPTVD